MQYSDDELVQIADWAEVIEKEPTQSPDMRRGASAIRQGCDWVLRSRVRERARELNEAGKPKRVERTA